MSTSGQQLLDELWVKAVERIGEHNLIRLPPGHPLLQPITIDDISPVDNEGWQHEFVTHDGMHCIHCYGYPNDLLHWTD